MNNEEKRYCEPFNMSPQEFKDYKSSKVSRVFLYIIAMLISSFFIDKWNGYITFTIILILSYVHNAKQEEQWLKDGNVKQEDLK